MLDCLDLSISCQMSVELSVAPMEGLTTRVFRKVHSEIFGPADSYYTPFVTPTSEPKFTERQMRELNPALNSGLNVIPQLLTNKPQDFEWAAKALYDLGYSEVNLNLGCPAGTVVAKCKGSGLLRNFDVLRPLLDGIFSQEHQIKISIKTRLGWSNPEEFEDLANLYSQYPLAKLIIHPRLKTDQYKGDCRKEIFEANFNKFSFPVGYNGDIVSTKDIHETLGRFPTLSMLMVGRGLVADPALFRKFNRGSAASKAEIRDFSEKLFTGYTEAFGSAKNAVMRMKEYWFFQLNLLSTEDKLAKKLFKAKDVQQYEDAVETIYENSDILPEARFGWHKPL